MNSFFRNGDTLLMTDDSPSEAPALFKGVTLAIEVADDTEHQRVFMALVEGGEGHHALTWLARRHIGDANRIDVARDY